jgi:glycerol-3-phosphate dehydrogenase
MADYDLAIIGGGLNGVSVARDAAGRGLRVILIEQGDLGGAASGASGRLIQGDLSVLERRAFRRTRMALAEREVWMRIAPHLVRPAHFVIPAHSDERPPWLLRLGLYLYDRLAPPDSLPRSATIDITHHPIGDALPRPSAGDHGKVARQRFGRVDGERRRDGAAHATAARRRRQAGPDHRQALVRHR